MSNISNISPNIIKDYQDSIASKASPATSKRKTASLNKFFDWAESSGQLSSNPMAVTSTVLPPPLPADYSIVTSKHKPKVGIKTWVAIGATLGLTGLTFLLAWKLNFPIPFITNRAADLSTNITNPIQTLPPKPTGQANPEPMSSAQTAVIPTEIPTQNPTPQEVPQTGAISTLSLTGQSPTIDASDGNLLIQGKTVTVKTTDGGDGNITLNPDGNGTLNLLFEGSGKKFLSAQASNLTSGTLYYGNVGNNSTGYNLLELQSGSPAITRFSVDGLGNTFASGNLYNLGNINTPGNIQIGGITRLSSQGRLSSITGYYQDSGAFGIDQGAPDSAKINKTLTASTGPATADGTTLTLDESAVSSGSDYNTLLLNRLGGTGNALLVNSGNALFKENLTVNSTFNAVLGVSTGGTQRIDGSGNLTSIGTTQLNGLTYTWPSSQSTNYILTTDGSGGLTWNDPSTLTAGTNYWDLSSGALFPKNSSTDLLIGSNSTRSAKFAFTNLLAGIPTASVSGKLNLYPYNGASGDLNFGPDLNFHYLPSPIALTGMVDVSTSKARSAQDAMLYLDNTSATNQYQATALRIVTNANTPDTTLGIHGINNGTGDFMFVDVLGSGGTGIAADVATAAASALAYQSVIKGNDQTSIKLQNIATSTNGNLLWLQQNTVNSGTAPIAIKLESFTSDPVMRFAIRTGGNAKTQYLWNDATNAPFFTTNSSDSNTYVMTYGSNTISERTLLALKGGSMFGLGLSTDPVAALDVSHQLSYGATGKSLAIFNQTENQDILTASASGVTKFVLDSSGDASMSGTLTLANGQAIQPAYGPLKLNWKSGVNTWTTGLTLTETNGNVGIGTTSPAARLVVSSNYAAQAAIFDSSVSTAENIGFSHSGTLDGGLGYSANGSAGMVLYNSSNGIILFASNTGNVGIGTQTTPSPLTLSDAAITTGNTIYATASAITSGDFLNLGEAGSQNFTGNGIHLDFDNTGGGSFTGKFLTFDNAGTTKYSVDSEGSASMSGTLTINGSSPTIATTDKKPLIIGDANTGGLVLNGTLPNPGGTLTDICLDSSNQVVLASGTSCSSSSERYKNTIEASNTGLSEVMAMRPVSFYYNDDIQKKSQLLGFIAEDVNQIDPRLVAFDKQGLPATVRYENYTAVLTKAIQEQQAQISLISGQIAENIVTATNFIAENIKSGAIITGDLATNSFTAFQGTIDNLLVKNGLVAGNIQTAMISPVADSTDVVVRLGNMATSSGKLAIQNTEGAEVSKIDSAGNATFNGNATVSGTLFANNINSKSLDDIKSMLGQVETDQTLLNQAANWSTNNSSAAAQLATLTAGDLFVTGQAAMNSLSVTKSILVGPDLVFSSNNSIDTLSAPLKLEALGLAPVEIMGGLVAIDTAGNVRIAGSLNVAGIIQSTGLTLEPKTGSALGDILAIKDASGSSVAVINAAGSATFNSVATQNLIIAGASNATDSAVLNGVITTNSMVGSAVVPAGLTEITIKNPKVTDYSLVYVTPTSDTQNNVLYVKSKQNGQFVVGFANPINIDANFNWWIVQIQN